MMGCGSQLLQKEKRGKKEIYLIHYIFKKERKKRKMKINIKKKGIGDLKSVLD